MRPYGVMTLTTEGNKVFHTKPVPFNREYRPGLADALSKAYTAHCDQNPDDTRETLSETHARICQNLLPQFPRWWE